MLALAAFAFGAFGLGKQSLVTLISAWGLAFNGVTAKFLLKEIFTMCARLYHCGLLRNDSLSRTTNSNVECATALGAAECLLRRQVLFVRSSWYAIVVSLLRSAVLCCSYDGLSVVSVIGGIVLTVVASPHATKEWELDELMGRYTVGHCPECVVSPCAHTVLRTDYRRVLQRTAAY